MALTHLIFGYTHFEAATINHLPAPVTTLMFGCSLTQIYAQEVRDRGSGPHWITIKPRVPVYSLGLQCEF